LKRAVLLTTRQGMPVTQAPKNSKKKKPKFKTLFALPGGRALRYALPNEKGNPSFWHRTFDLKYIRGWKTNRKRSLIRLSHWNSSGTEHLVCADFDCEPMPVVGSFDQLFDLLVFLFDRTHRGVTVRSSSNKVKCFFVVKLPPDTEMNTDIALDTLTKILPDDLLCLIDTSTPALSLTYLTRPMTERLSAGLPHLKPWAAVIEDVRVAVGGDTTCRTESNPVPKALKRYQGSIPLQFTSFTQDDPKREAFFRILLATPSLTSPTGFDLPSTSLAKQIGADKSGSGISKWRRELVELGWLKLIDESYTPRFKGKTFVATGPLFDALIVIHGPYRALKQLPLPRSIADGAWNQTLFDVAWRFVEDHGGYWAWFDSMPGCNLKDRRRQAENALRMQVKYLAKKNKAVVA
jgi:hypothetical protein